MVEKNKISRSWESCPNFCQNVRACIGRKIRKIPYTMICIWVLCICVWEYAQGKNSEKDIEQISHA